MVRLTEAALAQHYGRNGESQANLSTRENHRAGTTGRADKMESGGDRSARRARRSRPHLSSPVTRPAVKESLETPLNELPGPERLNPTRERCMWLPSTEVAAPAHAPEPPQQLVHELGSDDEEYWDQLEEIGMETISAMEAREQNAAAC